MTGEDLARAINGEAPSGNLGELQRRHPDNTQSHLGVTAGVNPSSSARAKARRARSVTHLLGCLFCSASSYILPL
jgi:hypothetical protein